MPVTARLSRKFYERFGDEIAGEFVDWFNAVDTTYHQQLRELNDLNWERFKAELHAAIAQSEARMTEKLLQGLATLSKEFSDRLSGTNSTISSTKTDLKSEIADFRAGLKSEIADSRADIMKWMFICWSGTVLSLGGLMVAVLAVVLRR